MAIPISWQKVKGLTSLGKMQQRNCPNSVDLLGPLRTHSSMARFFSFSAASAVVVSAHSYSAVIVTSA